MLAAQRRQAPKKRIRIPVYRKILYSAVCTFAFFLTFELVCAVFGLGKSTDLGDPFVGFSSQSPLFISVPREDGVIEMRTAPNKVRWFNEQSFPKKKALGTRRIFCLGGSTTYGHPFQDSTSFSGWLRTFLPIVDRSCEWEVINAGGISYASYRVAKLMEELVEYQPDLFVVYTAHNEFLERRTYPDMFDRSQFSIEAKAWLYQTQTWTTVASGIQKIKGAVTKSAANAAGTPYPMQGEVDEILNHTIGPVDYHRDPEWRRDVVAHYEFNLHRMIAIARKCSAKIVFVTPAVNEMHCSPFKSQHSEHLNADALNQIAQWMQNAWTTAGVSLDQSLDYLQRAIQLDPNYADLHYRAGKALFELGRFPEAHRAFRRAIQEDVCPLRAVDEIRLALDRVVTDARIPVVDFEKLLRRQSRAEFGHEIFGEEYFLDHVHPTIEVNKLLAIWIMEVLQDQRFVSGEPVRSQGPMEKLEIATESVLASIDREKLGIAQRNLAKVFHWAGKYEEAIPRARDAMQYLLDDMESRYVLADSLFNLGRLEQSANAFEQLFASGKEYPRAFEPYGLLLVQFEQWDAAKAYLLLAILHNEKSIPAYMGLGRVHLELMEFEFAEECFLKAKELDSSFVEAWYWLARTQAALNKHADAISLLEHVLGLGTKVAEVHYQYAVSLAAMQRLDDAQRQLQLALDLRPGWQEAMELSNEIRKPK